MRKAILILFFIFTIVIGFWLKNSTVSLADLQRTLDQKSSTASTRSYTTAATPQSDTLLADACLDLGANPADSTSVAQLIAVSDMRLSALDRSRLQALSPLFEQTMPASQLFAAQADKVIIVKGKNGTKLTIPAYAFTTDDNKTVLGELQLELKELYDVPSLLLANLPTLSDRGLLASESTLYLAATDAQGKPLKVSKGITVEIPTADKERNRGLFYGNSHTDGTWRWVASAADERRSSPNNYSTNPTDPNNNTNLLPDLMLGGGSASPITALMPMLARCYRWVQQYACLPVAWLPYLPASAQWTNNNAADYPFGVISSDSNQDTTADYRPRRAYRLPRTGNTFTITQTGWLSIHRYQPFYAAKRTISTHIDAPKDATVSAFLVLKNMSVVVPATRDAQNNYRFEHVPGGMKGYIVAMTYKQNQPYIDVLPMQTSDHKVATLSLRPTTVEQLKYQVGQLK